MQKSGLLETILFAFITLALTCGVLFASSFALFSESNNVGSHLQAGTLSAKLERIELRSFVFDDSGNAQELVDDTVKDFSGDNPSNLFGLDETDKIVPCNAFTAKMRLTNEGDVAFGYWLTVKITEGKDTRLAEQLTVTVLTDSNGENGAQATVKAGLPVGREEQPIAVVEKNGFKDFTVMVEFENKEAAENNLAKGESVKFDLIVYAAQVSA